MFLQLQKHRRLFILLLAAFYILTSSGISTLALQGAHTYYAHIIFPCKGSGCACDKAGYELRGCRCDHSARTNETACCSEIPVETCCSDIESCCEKDGEEINGPILKSPGCEGFESEDIFQAVNHLFLKLPQVEGSIQTQQIIYPASTGKLISTYPEIPDKVPIFS